MRKPPNLKPPYFYLTFFPGLSFTLDFCYLFPSKWHRRMVNASFIQFIAHSVCYSFLLILHLLHHEVSPMGGSFPQNSPMWTLPTGCSSSQIVQMCVSHGVQPLRNRLLWYWLLFLRRSTGSASSQLPTGTQPPLGLFTCSGMGCFMGSRMDMYYIFNT